MDDDRIYSEVAVSLLEHLAHQSPRLPKGKFASQESLAEELGLRDAVALRKVKGTHKGTHGWPAYLDFPDAIRTALESIAREYAGPAPFIREADLFLKGQGIDIALSAVGDEDHTLDDRWQSKYPSGDPLFVQACDRIVNRCQRGYGGDVRAEPDDRPYLSPFGAVLSVVLDEDCLLANSVGKHLAITSDGDGPIDILLPETCEGLASAIIPGRLFRQLEDDTGLTRQQAIDTMLFADWEIAVTATARSFFTGDAGHRFAGMVENCQNLLTAYRNDRLLMDRLSRLFESIADICTESDANAVRESFRTIRVYSRGDAARALASALLSAFIGLREYRALEGIVNGRWVK